jgi:hypothetical protein
MPNPKFELTTGQASREYSRIGRPAPLARAHSVPFHHRSRLSTYACATLGPPPIHFMSTEPVLTFFQLPITPAAFGLCALDQDGNLFFHPGLVSEDWHERARHDRVLKLVRFDQDHLVGLAPLNWARENQLEPPDRLDLLERFLRKFIARR